jgi:hypothetical protein
MENDVGLCLVHDMLHGIDIREVSFQDVKVFFQAP